MLLIKKQELFLKWNSSFPSSSSSLISISRSVKLERRINILKIYVQKKRLRFALTYLHLGIYIDKQTHEYVNSESKCI